MTMRRTNPSLTALLASVSALKYRRTLQANRIDEHENQTVIGLTQQLLPVFATVLGDPAEQLEDETRQKVIATVKFIASKNAALINGNEVLMNVLRG